MFVVRAVKASFLLLRQHAKIAVAAFVIAAAGTLAVGTFWPKQYTGSAEIALDPKAGVDQNHQHAAIAELLQQLPAEQDLSGIVSRFSLYPEVVAEKGVRQAEVYFLSKVSIQEVAADEHGGEAVKLAYNGDDKEAVLGVTDALAQSFTRAVTPPPPEAPPAAQPVLPAVPAPAPVPLPHKRMKTRHRRLRKRQAFVDTAAIRRKLDAAMQEEVALKAALQQNTVSAAHLKQERARLTAAAERASHPPAAPEHHASAEELGVRQQLADAKTKLVQLRERYTEQYPDVIATKGKVQELQTELNQILASAPVVPAPPKRETVNPATLAAVGNEESSANDAQTKLEQELDRNRLEMASLQAKLDRARNSTVVVMADDGEDDSDVSPAAVMPVLTSPATPAPPAPATPAAAVASFVIVQDAILHSSPVIFNKQILWPLSFVLGLFAAMLAAYFAERHDPSIKNEGMLRREMPASAVYLGGVPRIRHEIIVD